MNHMNESVCISPRCDHHAVTDEQFVFNRYSLADKRLYPRTTTAAVVCRPKPTGMWNGRW
jgi:hypothetical protein